MKQKTFIVCLLSFLVFGAGQVFAQQKTVNNILFEIVRIDRPAAVENTASYIAISYQLTNNDLQRKLSLEAGISATLTDEFGNQYRKIDPPDPSRPLHRNLPTGFPSVYPGQAYGEDLYFEAPIAKANRLSLNLSVTDLAVPSPVKIPIVLSEAIPNSVTIVDPLNGTVLSQGQVAHLNINVTGEAPPKRLVVMAFGNVFEDNHPSFDNVYDINVPLSQDKGTYLINVIAQWPLGEDDATTLSDEISVDVKEAVPIDIF